MVVRDGTRKRSLLTRTMLALAMVVFLAFCSVVIGGPFRLPIEYCGASGYRMSILLCVYAFVNTHYHTLLWVLRYGHVRMYNCIGEAVNMDTPKHTIRELREKRGWSQFELAVMVGVRPQTVLNWEHGRREPRASQFIQLGRVFEVPLESIVLVEAPGVKTLAA